MRYSRPAFRLVSIIAAASMIIPILAPAAQAAVVSILAPQPGERVPGRNVEVAVGYNTQSDLKVTRLELWIDGRLHTPRNLLQPLSKGVSSFWWDAGKANSGSHEIVVKAFAGNTLVGKSSSHATIGRSIYDLRAPNVRIANVKPNQVVSGKTPVIIESSDDGDDAPIVSLLVDNSLKMLSNTKPLVYELDTTQYTNGNHELKVLAYDSSGNKSEPLCIPVLFRNNVELPVAVVPTPTTAPTGVPASEDDYAPVIPPIEEVVGKSSATAARAVSDPSAEPLAPAVAHSLLQAKRAGQSKPVFRKQGQLTPAPVVVKLRPGPHPQKSAAAQIVQKPKPVQVAAKPGPAKATVSTEKPVAPAAKATSSVTPDIEQPKAARKAPAVTPIAAADAAQGPSRDGAATTPPQPAPSSGPVVIAMVPEPVAPHFTAEIAPITEGPMIPLPDVQPDESLPDVQPASKIASETLVAMAMTRENDARQPTVVRTIPTRKDTKAKLEKTVIPVAGKVKIRDIFDGIGGVLFWDQATRTVTGYVSGMKMELRIGSRLMRVNGKTAKIQRAPYIVAGRTIIDAGVYHLAREMAHSSRQVAQK